MSTDLHHLSGAYALDALDPTERRAFEAHYPGCDICAEEVADYRTLAEHLAAGASTPPPDGLRALVMAEVSTTRQVSPLPPAVHDPPAPAGGTGRPLVVAAIAAAIVVLAAVAGILVWNTPANQADEVLAAPDATVTELDGADGSVRLVWSDDLGRVAVFATDLPDPGAEMAYALWSIDDATATPAGQFDPEADGTVRTVLDVADIEPDQWGVTIEADPDAAQPTEPILYAGEV